MTEKLALPKQFESYRTIFEQSNKPLLSISLHVEENILKTDCKVFGQPYFPKNMPYPTNEQGEPLKLLAQLNFEQMPVFEHFPTSGLLQFYVDPYDDVSGMDFDDGTNQANFRVIYHETIEKDMLSDEELPTFNEENLMMPGNTEAKMYFKEATKPVSFVDYRAKEFALPSFDFDEAWEEYMEMYYAQPMHQVGGYSYFTQEDPRNYASNGYEAYEIMLLQIDSDMEIDLMWGDMGIGNFFITAEDLDARNFSRVLYNWDCG